MTNIADIELTRALAAAGCGILRRPRTDRPQEPERDWLIVATKGTDEGPSLATILRVVSDVTRVNTAELKSPRRRKDIVRARTIYYILARQLTIHSLVVIGRSCGGRDHCTVLHGLSKVDENRSAFEPEMSRALAALGRGGWRG